MAYMSRVPPICFRCPLSIPAHPHFHSSSVRVVPLMAGEDGRILELRGAGNKEAKPEMCTVSQ